MPREQFHLFFTYCKNESPSLCSIFIILWSASSIIIFAGDVPKDKLGTSFKFLVSGFQTLAAVKGVLSLKGKPSKILTLRNLPFLSTSIISPAVV